MSKKVIVKVLTYLSDHSQTVVIFVLLPSSSSSFGLGRDSPHNISPHLAVTHGCPKILHIQSGIPGYNFGEGQPPRSHRKMAGAP